MASKNKAAGFAFTTRQDQELTRVIAEYSKTWVLLTQFDNQLLEYPKSVTKAKFSLAYEEAAAAIEAMKKHLGKKLGDSALYGCERSDGLRSLIGNLGQTFNKKPLYPTLEHQAAHLLYFVIKDHPFVDGNKRIGAYLFIYFLQRHKYLSRKGQRKLNDNGLTALTILVATSDPTEKDTVIKLIMNFIGK